MRVLTTVPPRIYTAPPYTPLLSKAKGIMNIDVLSFVRLAYRALGQTTALDKPLLEDEGKCEY